MAYDYCFIDVQECAAASMGSSNDIWRPSNGELATVMQQRQYRSLINENTYKLKEAANIGKKSVLVYNTTQSYSGGGDIVTSQLSISDLISNGGTPNPKLTRCCICGGFLTGVGPGLHETQNFLRNGGSSDGNESVYDHFNVSGDKNNLELTSLSSVTFDEPENDCISTTSESPTTPSLLFTGVKKSSHFDLARIGLQREPKRPVTPASRRKPKKIRRSMTPVKGQQRSKNSYDAKTQPRALGELDKESRVAPLCLYCTTHSDLSVMQKPVRYTYVEKYGVKYKIKTNENSNIGGGAVPPHSLSSSDLIKNERDCVTSVVTSTAAALAPSVPKKFNARDILLVTRAANVFIYFNGFKPSLTMSATTFRNMARSCQLCDQQSLPSVDILYMDVMRSWCGYGRDSPYNSNPRNTGSILSQQAHGLSFPAFVEALFKLAKFQFRGSNLHEKFSALLSNCDKCIRDSKWSELKAKRRLKFASLRRKALNSHSPRISCSSSQRNPYF